MRLRDTRIYCAFSDGNAKPIVLRESCWREATIQSLSAVSSCTPSCKINILLCICGRASLPHISRIYVICLFFFFVEIVEYMYVILA